LGLKIKVDDLSVVYTQNHWNGFSLVSTSKSMAMIYEWFNLKITQTVFWLRSIFSGPAGVALRS
jgi:hypothetical protein